MEKYVKITSAGEEFIKGVAQRLSEQQGNTSMITGKNKYNLNYSDKQDQSITWTANVFDENGRKINTNAEFAIFLINTINKYCQIYGLDANIIAAQIFQESTYKAWNYASTSTASGICQFLMLTTFDVIYEKKYIVGTDKEKLIKNMELPELRTSWIGVVKKSEYTEQDRQRQLRNRSILFQNIIDNPAIMIKAQCALMDFIARRNKNLAANTLFAYNRGSGYVGNSYTEIVNKVAKEKGNEFIKEGVDYVQKIVGYLADKDNTIVKTQPKIVKGLWFGYKDFDFGFDSFNGNLG